MTYRIGAYVMDTETARVGQVVGESASRVILRQPGTGLEWEADPRVLRLASRDEREAIGVHSNGTSVVGHLAGEDSVTVQADCEECQRLGRAEAEARSASNHSRAADYRVLARRHLRNVHGVAVAVGA
ncbi:hypothetical protein GCM10009753_25870 [Streptantibioticus ferralitis]